MNAGMNAGMIAPEIEPSAPYASAAACRAAAWAALLPPSDAKVSETAEKLRVLDNPGGGYSGPWRNAVAPYLVKIMDSLTNRLYHTTAFVAPAQCGKTEVLLNWALHNLTESPADMLIIQSEQKMADDFSARRRDKLIATTKSLRDAVTAKNLQSLTANGAMLTISYPTGAQAASRPVGKIAMDEYDSVPDDVDGEGDAYSLYQKRAQTFGAHGHVFVTSSPKKPIKAKASESGPHAAPKASGIFGLYGRSTARRYYWRCPVCGDWFVPGFDMLKYPAEATADDDYIDVTMAAPCCGGLIGFAERAALNMGGEWLAKGESMSPEGVVVGAPSSARIDGYWLDGTQAAFCTWEDLVRKYLTAMKELSELGSDGKLKTFYNVELGAVYEPRKKQENRIDAAALAGRAENYPLGVVPVEARVVVTAVDTQGSYWDCQTVAVGPGGEMWVIDRWQVAESDGRSLSPGTRPADWLALKERVLQKTWPIAGRGDWRMAAATTLIDIGGGEGVTANAKKFWHQTKLWMKDADLRLTLVKGDKFSSPAPMRKSLVDDDSGRKVKIFLLDANRFKDELAGMLGCDEPGPGYIHFPAALAVREKPDQTPEFFAQLAAETRDENGKWTKTRQRNETLDLFCYALAGLKRLGGDHINWDRPNRSWALPHEENPYVIRGGAAAAQNELPFAAAPTPTIPHPAFMRRPPVVGGGESWIS